LIGRPHIKLSKLTHIASHPQALAQCQKFLKTLRKKNPNFEILETSSTAEARNRVLDHPTIAALGGEKAVENSLLEILEEDIADEKKNYTRFVVISAQNLKKILKGRGKLTAIFQLNHETGALAKLLTKISEAGGNLWKIESRPVPGMMWEYSFWADIEVDEDLRKPMIDLLKMETRKCRILGVYPMGEILKS
jgi:prephenate dehydratase